MTPQKGRYFSDVNLFYAHAGLFAFAEVIFLFSLPVLLWNKGFPLSFIFAFYALAALPGYFFTSNVVRYMLKNSVKSMLVFGVLLYVALGVVVPMMETDSWWWILALVVLSLQALCYFPARHLYFSELISKKTVGVQSGMLSAVVVIVRTIAPIVAGSIAVLTEFNLIFIFGAAVLLLSIGPIILIKSKVKMNFKVAEFEAMAKDHHVFQNTKAAYIADGVNGVISYTLWPLLFLLLISENNFFDLGSLMTISYAVSAIIMLAVGHFFDKQYRKKLLNWSVVANILASVGRFMLLFFHPMFFVYIIQSLYCFAESALQSTFDAYWYAYSKKTNVVFFTIHRERNFALGRFWGGLIIAFIAFLLPDAASLWPLFLLSIPVVFVYLKKGDSDHYLA